MKFVKKDWKWKYVLCDNNLKDPIDVISSSIVLDNGIGASSHEVVDWVDYVGQFVLGDQPVAVDVVQSECPPQFIVHRSSRQNRQSYHKVLQNVIIIVIAFYLLELEWIWNICGVETWYTIEKKQLCYIFSYQSFYTLQVNLT